LGSLGHAQKARPFRLGENLGRKRRITQKDRPFGVRQKPRTKTMDYTKGQTFWRDAHRRPRAQKARPFRLGENLDENDGLHKRTDLLEPAKGQTFWSLRIAQRARPIRLGENLGRKRRITQKDRPFGGTRTEGPAHRRPRIAQKARPFRLGKNLRRKRRIAQKDRPFGACRRRTEGQTFSPQRKPRTKTTDCTEG